MIACLFSFFILLAHTPAIGGCIQAGQEQAEAKKITEMRKAAGVSTDAFMMLTYPPISFQGAALPTVWLGPEFLELVGEPKADGKSFYHGLCSLYDEKDCQQWCFVLSDSPQFYTAQAQSKIIDQCQKCESGKGCDGVHFLKKPSDSFTLNTFEKKPVMVQMGVKGQLLVFQTGNEGKKDLGKPYLKITHLSSEQSTYQKLESVGGAEGSVAAESFFKKDSNYGYYGFRVCDQAVLSLSSCNTQIKSTGNTGIAFSCKPKSPQQAPGTQNDVGTKR